MHSVICNLESALCILKSLSSPSAPGSAPLIVRLLGAILCRESDHTVASLAFLGLLIAGTCDRILYARLHDNSTAAQPVFAIGSNPDYSGRVLVYAAAVTGTAWDSSGRADTTRSWRTFWEMRVDSGRKWVPLNELRYGAAPFYCHTVFGPDSLRTGHVYACDIRCYGLSPPSILRSSRTAPAGRRFTHSPTSSFTTGSGVRIDVQRPLTTATNR